MLTNLLASVVLGQLGQVVTGSPPKSVHLALGVPRAKGKDVVLLRYSEYFVLFDTKKKIPVWVSYQLTKEHAKPRRSPGHVAFAAERALPDGSYAADSDYDGWHRKPYWFQKGHLAPDADFRWNEQRRLETYIYSNCVPQNRTFNAGQWGSLEKDVRAVAADKGSVWIITGAVTGKKKHANNPNVDKIGNGVSVPTHLFKIVVRKTSTGYRASAYLAENMDPRLDPKRRTRTSWVTTVDDIEDLTGLNFCNALPEVEQSRFEGKHISVEQL